VVQSQSRQIVCETLSQKCPSQKGLAEWLKVKAMSSSSSTAKKEKEKKKRVGKENNGGDEPSQDR
jgi:hypothetical protein